MIPLDKPVRAEITVPGSKSITNRALILAALAGGEVTLAGALWSEDTQIMVGCLQQLGFEIRVENDPDEFCNRTITVKGLGGKIPKAGSVGKPLELFVGNAGTAARFLAAFACLGNGVYRLSGVPRMHERPQAALFAALRELGYRVEIEKGNDKLPVTICGDKLEAACCADRTPQRDAPTKQCKVSIAESSQFASALLLCAKVGGWEIEVVGENAEESPYVAMTSKMIEAFPHRGGKFQIEPDASSGSYFWIIDLLGPCAEGCALHAVRVSHWPKSGWQIDERFPDYLLFGNRAREAHEIFRKHGHDELSRKLIKQLMQQSTNKISRKDDLGDSIMTAIVWSAQEEARSHLFNAKIRSKKAFHFTDLGRLRVQECERVAALHRELEICGAEIIEEGDTLTVYPSPLHGAEIETYNDHRMAMCFAALGLKVPGIKIKNPACVRKTFPNFFQKLAAPPPHGLGATILDVRTGEKLTHNELFAD